MEFVLPEKDEDVIELILQCCGALGWQLAVETPPEGTDPDVEGLVIGTEDFVRRHTENVSTTSIIYTEKPEQEG